MAIITMITDWGETDYYTAAVKGAILCLMPDAVIVDITHKVPRFDIAQTAYLLGNAYESFPTGTVHIIGVASEETEENFHVAVSYKGQYFIGLDNGIFSLLFPKPPDEVVTLDVFYSNENATTFPERDRFAKAAVLLAQGKKLSEIGTPREALVQKSAFQPTAGKSTIHGMVVHIDSYENLITNISYPLFKKVIGAQPFKIEVKGYTAHTISEGYFKVAVSEIACLFGCNGFLQIAINRGKASSLLNIKKREKVTISVVEKKEETPFQLY